MTAAEIVADLQRRGVSLIADGAHLRCRPRSALLDAELEFLREHKTEVLTLLRTERPTKLVCYACHGRRFWLSIHGVTVCATCHPPARPDLVARWLDGPAEDRDDG